MLRLSKLIMDTNLKHGHKFWDFSMRNNIINANLHELTRRKENPSKWVIGLYKEFIGML